MLTKSINFKNFKSSKSSKSNKKIKKDLDFFLKEKSEVLKSLNADYKNIEKAANFAGVSQFTDSLPMKLNTIVGESGIKVSGGQRQRIAIARAIIKNAPILLLDEATSSLDNLTENQIQESINKLMKNKTSIVVAHRLSTIEDADLIYVIENGKVIESGNHKDLLKNSSLYKNLQMKENLENEY